MKGSDALVITREEHIIILRKYRELLTYWVGANERSKEDRALVKKAFLLAYEAHKSMRRRSGEPYIYHPIEVAIVCTKEIGLGTTSVISALLHDVVEDTDYTIADMENLFTPRIAAIIDGLTKIKDFFDQDERALKAINHKKIIVTLADDVRVILIKLADRLHNMRTLEAMPAHKQIKISFETTNLYVPLAHRLGLYQIKSELEDICLRFTDPDIYASLSEKLEERMRVHESNIRGFVLPIKGKMARAGYKFDILERTKSLNSIWGKMQKKELPFEEIYDIFAIRIIVDVPPEDERRICWDINSIITECYKPKPDRLRDWISTPKANGYQALHTTVMSQFGDWVEIQIRSKRMDEVAEKGYAAHWKYKDVPSSGSNLEHWLDRIRDMLMNPDSNALDFMDDFRGYLFTREVFVFTPQGEQRLLPQDATVLDFAYAIHSEIGRTCIGANVNHSIKPRSYRLKNGDQINIVTSKAQQPEDSWLDIVVTSRAKSRIRQQLRELKKPYYEEGMVKLERLIKEINIESTPEIIDKILLIKPYRSKLDLAYDIVFNKIGIAEIRQALDVFEKKWYERINPFSNKPQNDEKSTILDARSKKTEELVLNETELNKVSLAQCCHPVNGDDVIAYTTKTDGIIVHRARCEKGKKELKQHADKVIKTRWNREASIDVLAGIYFEGIDRKGLVHEITGVINLGDTNMKSFSISAHEGVCEGEIIVFINNNKKLEQLMNNIKKINGVKRIHRVNRTKHST